MRWGIFKHEDYRLVRRWMGMVTQANRPTFDFEVIPFNLTSKGLVRNFTLHKWFYCSMKLKRSTRVAGACPPNSQDQTQRQLSELNAKLPRSYSTIRREHMQHMQYAMPRVPNTAVVDAYSVHWTWPGITVWGDALDLSSTSTLYDSSTYQVVFHYTNFLALQRIITNEAGKGTSASLNFLVILYVGIIIKNSPNIWVAYHYRLPFAAFVWCVTDFKISQCDFDDLMIEWFCIFCIQIKFYNLKIYFNPCSLHYLSSPITPILFISGIKVQGMLQPRGHQPVGSVVSGQGQTLNFGPRWRSKVLRLMPGMVGGLYTVPLAPDGWENIDAILDAWQRERNGVKYLRCRMRLRWPGHMMAADGTCNMTVFWAMTLRPWKLNFYSSIIARF